MPITEMETKNDMPPPVTETERLRRRNAYEEIIRHNEAALLRVAWRFSRNQEAAQDLVQEALVRGYEAFLDGRFREGTNPRAWLMTILTNCFLMDRRRHQRFTNENEVSELLEGGAECVITLHSEPALPPDRALLTTQIDEPIEKALAALPDDLRISVVLVDIEELTYEEASSVLEIPIGTLRSRLFRARKQLYHLLHEYGRQRRRI